MSSSGVDLVYKSVRPQVKGVYAEFMVVKPYPVAMIQTPSGVYAILQFGLLLSYSVI